MRRLFTGLFAVAVFATVARADSTRPPQESPPQAPPTQPPAKKEPSLHGNWVGYWSPGGGIRVKLTSTIREDGTYKTVAENGDYVAVEKGKYKYADGVLNTEPDEGMLGTYTVTFEDKDTIRVKGNGLSIVYKRQ